MTYRILNKWTRVAAMLPAAFLLTGCLSTYSYRTAETTLCQAEAGSDWHGRGTALGFERNGVKYHFRMDDLGSKNSDRYGAEGKFWVLVDGYTSGSAAGAYAPAMVFDPRDAVIEIDGRRIAALPELWEAAIIRGYYRPLRQVAIPANLNLLGRPVPTSFFMAFSMPDPGTHSTYRIHPGSIALDGVKTPLPAFSSCYKSGEGRWTPVH